MLPLTAIGEEEVRNEMEEVIKFYSFRDPYSYDEFNPVMNIWVAYKETPKGYWIVPDYHYYGEYVTSTLRKWIQKEYSPTTAHKKKFAYRNKDDALCSYYRRKLEHIRYVAIRHSHIKCIIRRIENKHGFFGHTRPAFDKIDESCFAYLTPLNKERPAEDFINDSEFML